jgi:hypothetical protein
MVKSVALANLTAMRTAAVTAANTAPTNNAVLTNAVLTNAAPVKTGSRNAAPRDAAPGRPRPRNAGRRRCPVLAFIRRLTARLRARGREAGTTTAEYAIGTMAACAFAAVLYKIVTSQSVANLLAGIIHRALGSAG